MRYHLFFILWVLVGSVSAWWDNGHLLVARIAQSQLYKTNKPKFDKAKNILSVL